MYDNFWITKNIQSIESKVTKDFINNNSRYYIIPATIYSGFANLTENGIQSNNTLISDFTSFSKVFTGKEGIVAVIDNALKLYAKKVPEIFNREYTIIREFTESDLKKALTKNSSFVEIKYYDLDGNLLPETNIYTYNGNSEFINANNEVKETISNILSVWNLGIDTKDDDLDLIKQYFINVVDITKIGSVLNSNYKRELQEPQYFKGSLNNVSFGAQFTNLPQMEQIGQYVSLTSARTINISTTNQLFKQDLFKFYLIPLQSGNNRSNDLEWFFISNIQPYHTIDGKFIYNEVSFTSINDSIQTTGQTIQQFIQTGSMGEGKILPLVKFDDKGVPNNIDLNYDLAVDSGVNTLQIEVLGPAATNGIKIIGRPFERKGSISKRVYAPRNLYAYKMKYPTPNTLTQNSNPENSFYLTSATPIINKYYDKWIDKLRADISQNYKQRFEGYLECNANTINTNQGLDKVKFNVISSNFNLKNSDVLKNQNYITKLNPLFTINLPDNTIAGNTEFNINNLNKSIIGAADILNLGYEAYTWLEELPIDIKQTTTWFLSDIPLIGGFLNTLNLGIPVGWRQEKYANNEAFPHISKSNPTFLISSSIYDWYTQAFFGVDGGANDRKNYLPLDLFKTGTSDEVGSIIGASASNTTFAFSLSDKVVANRLSKKSKSIVGKEIISTLYLGQEDPYNTDHIFIIGNDWDVLDPTTQTKYTDIIGNENYIVDFISYQGLAKTDLRITSFYEDPDIPSTLLPSSTQNYYVVISTTSKRTNSIRSWRTNYKMSYLDNYIQDEVQFPFPTFLSLPEPIITGIKDKTENLSKFNKVFVDKQKLDTSSYSGNETNTINLIDMRKYGILTLDQLINYYDEVSIDVKSYAVGRNRYHTRIFGVYGGERNLFWDSNGISFDNLIKHTDTKRNININTASQPIIIKTKDLKNKVLLNKHNVNFVDVNDDSYDLVNVNYNYESNIYFENGIIKMDYLANWQCNGEGHGDGFELWYIDTSLQLTHYFGDIIVKGK